MSAKTARLAFSIILSGFVLAVLAGCDRADTAKPPAQLPDREAITYYGRMILVDHRGPKAQILLRSQQSPLWFSQVRDAIAFTLSLEEDPADLAAIYVTDMSGEADWDSPQHWNSLQQWLPAETAIYVIDSDHRGGMGALEAVPFSQHEAAEAFSRMSA